MANEAKIEAILVACETCGVGVSEGLHIHCKRDEHGWVYGTLVPLAARRPAADEGETP